MLQQSTDASYFHDSVTTLCPATATLSDEILARCLAWLTLADLPNCGSVASRWKDDFRIAFADVLSWRVGTPVWHADILIRDFPHGDLSVVGRASGQITALCDGSFLVSLIDLNVTGVRSFRIRFGCESSNSDNVQELHPPRCRLCDVYVGGVGGIVGHIDDSMVFFPSATSTGEPLLQTVREVRKSYQNVLHSGNQLFLLHPGDRFADLLHFETGHWLRLKLRCFCDGIEREQGDERAQRNAVSATSEHFVRHINTANGGKVVAAIHLPSAACGAQSVEDAECMEATVSFIRYWPPGHPISDVLNPDEKPVGDNLLLWGPWETAGLLVSLLNAATGNVKGQRLQWPSRSGLARRSFHDHGYVGALTAIVHANLICACGATPRDLQPPPIVIWDFETGLVLAEYSTQGDAVLTMSSQIDDPNASIQDEEQVLEPHALGLRFRVGDRVECRTRIGWLPGEIITCHYREIDWPVGETAAYQIRCADGSLHFAPQDIPQLVRRRAASNLYDDYYQPQLAICPDSRQVLVGLFHRSEPKSRLHVLSCKGQD